MGSCREAHLSFSFCPDRRFVISSPLNCASYSPPFWTLCTFLSFHSCDLSAVYIRSHHLSGCNSQLLLMVLCTKSYFFFSSPTVSYIELYCWAWTWPICDLGNLLSNQISVSPQGTAPTLSPAEKLYLQLLTQLAPFVFSSVKPFLPHQWHLLSLSYIPGTLPYLFLSWNESDDSSALLITSREWIFQWVLLGKSIAHMGKKIKVRFLVSHHTPKFPSETIHLNIKSKTL